MTKSTLSEIKEELDNKYYMPEIIRKWLHSLIDQTYRKGIEDAIQIVGKDEEFMSSKEADEVYEMNKGNIDYQTILDVGVQKRIYRNQLRKEITTNLTSLLEKK